MNEITALSSGISFIACFLTTAIISFVTRRRYFPSLILSVLLITWYLTYNLVIPFFRYLLYDDQAVWLFFADIGVALIWIFLITALSTGYWIFSELIILVSKALRENTRKPENTLQ
jgi:hypothetical protein